MIKIIGDSSTGKTGRLFLLAKENNGIIVCKNSESMRVKSHAYGITGIDFINYETYIEHMKYTQPNTRPVYIDDISDFLRVYNKNIAGYTETV